MDRKMPMCSIKTMILHERLVIMVAKQEKAMMPHKQQRLLTSLLLMYMRHVLASSRIKKGWIKGWFSKVVLYDWSLGEGLGYLQDQGI